MNRGEVQQESIGRLIASVERIIIGKRPVIELVITSLLAGGHVLLEDVPGVGKTQLAASLAQSCGGQFNRLQMTPDVMPSDVTGFSMIRQDNQAMEFRKGAVFCNFLLADEINRSSPKSQSALLEAMEESKVSIDGQTFQLPDPFMVLATENPVETYGTYHLPEAQMDRFLMKLSMGYPSPDQELAILQKSKEDKPELLTKVLSIEEIVGLKAQAEAVTASESLQRYIVALVEASRKEDGIRLGISPRGSIAMLRAAKAYAFLQGRDYVVPEDVKALAVPVWAHRLMLSPQGRSKWNDGLGAVNYLLSSVAVPLK